jgi:hypothetical protein
LHGFLVAVLMITALLGAFRYGWDIGYREGQAEVHGRGKPYNVNYNLSFLVEDSGVGGQIDFKQFEKFVYRAIEPNSWELNGGHGRIEYFASNQSAVVWNHRSAHVAFAKLIKQLAKTHEAEK